MDNQYQYVQVSKFSDEYKEGEYSMTKKVRDALVFDGSTRKEWGFQSVRHFQNNLKIKSFDNA
jgi:hypothetical protein